jgi:hypothetical protein
MTSPATPRRALRLVPKPEGAIDADMVAFTIMEFIDQNFPEVWAAAPRPARVTIRNRIVRAVMAEDSKR